MAASLCQSVLDALTDVDMPKRHPTRGAQGSLDADHICLPVYACDALVLGWRAAVELKRHRIDVVVATQNLYGGTSGCSRSDKRTLPATATGRHGDDFMALAAALGAGGAMDEDTAYVEAVGLLRALSSLQYLGLPVPLDQLGAEPRRSLVYSHFVQRIAVPKIRLGLLSYDALTSSSRPVDPANSTATASTQALLRRPRTCARSGRGDGESDGKSVRDRDAARWISLESVGNVPAVPTLHLLRRHRWSRTQFPRGLLSNYAGARVQHLPQGLSMAIPWLMNARLRF